MQSGRLCCKIFRRKTATTNSFIASVSLPTPNIEHLHWQKSSQIQSPNIYFKRISQFCASPVERQSKPAEPDLPPPEDQDKKHQALSRRHLKSIRVPPPRLLAEWLEENEDGHIVVKDHRSDRGKVLVPDMLSLQNILLAYLRRKHTKYTEKVNMNYPS